MASVTRRPSGSASIAARDGGSSAHSPSGSVSSIGRPGTTFPADLFQTSQYIGRPHSRPSTSGTAGPSSAVIAGPSGTAVKRQKPSYSWNEIVDRENLGVRPGEVEILPNEFQVMCVMISHCFRFRDVLIDWQASLGIVYWRQTRALG
jgi:hypothetical protein